MDQSVRFIAVPAREQVEKSQNAVVQIAVGTQLCNYAAEGILQRRILLGIIVQHHLAGIRGGRIQCVVQHLHIIAVHLLHVQHIVLARRDQMVEHGDLACRFLRQNSRQVQHIAADAGVQLIERIYMELALLGQGSHTVNKGILFPADGVCNRHPLRAVEAGRIVFCLQLAGSDRKQPISGVADRNRFGGNQRTRIQDCRCNRLIAVAVFCNERIEVLRCFCSQSRDIQPLHNARYQQKKCQHRG